MSGSDKRSTTPGGGQNRIPQVFWGVTAGLAAVWIGIAAIEVARGDRDDLAPLLGYFAVTAIAVSALLPGWRR
jgi:hypothetical protein